MTRVLLAFAALCVVAPSLFGQQFATPRPEPRPAALATPAVAVPLDTAPGWTSADAGAYSTGMAWRDINNDGQVDVFFSNGNDIERAENTAYYLQNWQLPATPSWQSANEEYSGHCAAGDINDDGYADFAVANFLGMNRFASPGHTNLYMNTGGTLLASPSWVAADSCYSFSCALGDADGDGDLDLAIATGEPYGGVFERDRIYFNIDGSLQALPGWQSDSFTAAMDVAWGDIDRDGDLDLAFCYDNFPATVFFNSGGTLATSPGWQAAVADPANTLVLGDVNGDGWLDMVVAYNDQLGGGGYFMAYFNDGAGSLHTSPDWISGNGGYGAALALYDYDLDGDPDLAAGRWFDRPRVYENIGGTFSSDPVWRSNIATVPEAMAWVDVDGSGVVPFADTLPADGHRVLYTTRAPWYLLDSVVVDGELLGHDEFCYDPVGGWISLAAQPLSHTTVYYQYSFTADLAVSNWDMGNHVYYNSSDHVVSLSAIPDSGWAPLTVQFTNTTDNTMTSEWDFGDGSQSSDLAPLHTYDLPGSYDVSLAVTTSLGSYTRTVRDMIMVLADTVTFGRDSVFPGEKIMIPVSMTNSQPLQRIVLPISLADLPIDITPDSVKRGARTAGFNQPGFLAYVYANHRYDMTIELVAGPSGPLMPGTGEILRLYATVNWNAPVGAANLIDTIPNGSYECEATTALRSYNPKISAGELRTRYVARGDVNADSHLSLTDLTQLANYLFLAGTRPVAFVACDINGDSSLNLSDLTYLVNYLFLLGPPPPPYS